jgi:hypothetical protein
VPAPESQLTAKAFSAQLKDLPTLLSAIGSIAILIFPSINAYFEGQPLLINYYDLLQTLVGLAAK